MALPGIQQRRTLAARLQHLHPGHGRFRQPACHDQADSVVAAVVVADTDDQGSWFHAMCTGRSTGNSTDRLDGCVALDGEFQEVGRAGDAGIIIADGLLATPLERFLVEVQVAFHHRAQIRLDLQLVL